MRRGLLDLGKHQWRFGDANNGTTRRFDQRKWKRADNDGPDWHKLIGLSDVIRYDRRYVLFVIEGSKDALAAAELAQRCGILTQTSIVCALGSGYRPITSELQQLRGRLVVLIGDNDAAGFETAQIVSPALEHADVDHCIWAWSAWQGRCKDLFELLESG